ncbi:MAG: hypothetical protein HYR56_02330 [Acidobacteria bacterium]|nr:hypothetical protein [Acidobacteriota bacterium]MBI3421348.1 hypothetical protein [Acidobacteriota bacterium]
MLKDFFAFFQHTLTVAKDHERLRKDIEQLERTQVEHGLLLQRLADQIIMNQRHDQDAREKLALQLQVELLKFEKRLPPADK